LFLLQNNINVGGESIWGLLGGKRFFPDLIRESAWHGRGLVCMASYGNPHTNASAFFIVLGDASHIRFRNLVTTATVVGRVVDGFETLDKLDKVSNCYTFIYWPPRQRQKKLMFPPFKCV